MTILAFLLAVLVPSPAARTATPAAEAPCASAAPASLQKEFLEFINQSRRRRKLTPLRYAEALCRAAQKRADAIGRSDGSELEAMGGEDLLALVGREGYDARVAGELLVQASGTPREIAAGWNRDLLAGEGFGIPEAREMGIGLAELDETPLHVFLFARSAGEDFQERTAGISDREAVLTVMLEKVNAARRKELKRPRSETDLRRNGVLDRAAQAHADDMLARAFYGHESPEGRDAWSRARTAGYRALIVGENIAQGQSSLEEVMTGWMESPEHRKNILNPLYAEAGFGLAVGRNAQGYQVLWVQVFARPLSGSRS